MNIIGTINPDATHRIIVASALLMGAIIVLFLVVWYYRKCFLSDDAASGAQTWTFQDLRQMKENGELTEEEYEALRASLISSFQHSGGPQPSPDSPKTANREHEKNFDLEKGHDG